MTIKDLLKKGGGTLVRVSGVWTYPGAPLDQSGTNLRLPIEHVSDAEVREALGKDELVVATTNADGSPLALRLAGDAGTVLSSAQVGTAEAGTELPAGSRPSVDAGRPFATEGAEQPAKDPKAAGKEPTSESDPRKGR